MRCFRLSNIVATSCGASARAEVCNRGGVLSTICVRGAKRIQCTAPVPRSIPPAGEDDAGVRSMFGASIPAMLRRLYQVVVLDSVSGMERCMQAPEGARRSPRFKAMTALGATAILLTLLNFVALSSEWQADLADRAWEFAIGLSDGPLKDALLAASPLFRHAAWTLGCISCYFLVPALIVVAVFREPLSEYGLTGRGFVRHLPIYLLLLAPVLVAVVIASGTEAFQETYPFYRNPHGWGDLLGWEALYASQFFALEFFFRGFLLHSLKGRLGVLAVPAMVVPYVMIHFTKPMPEAFGAVIAGTVLGVLALRTGTIWGGVFVHAAVAISMDVAALLQRGGLPGSH